MYDIVSIIIATIGWGIATMTTYTIMPTTIVIAIVIVDMIHIIHLYPLLTVEFGVISQMNENIYF